MNFSEFLIIFGGIFSIVMSIFHTQFSRIFKWKISFKEKAIVNYKILYTINIALILFLFSSGIFSITFASRLAEKGSIELSILIFLSLFWIWRTIWETLYFKVPKNIEKRPIIHYIFVIYFLLCSIFYTLSVFF